MLTPDNNASGTSSSTSFEKEHMTNGTSLIAGYYMIAICILGVIENVLVLSTFRRHPNLRFISSDLVRILCLYDIAMAVCAFPLIFISCMANRWLFSDIGCQLYGCFMTAIGFGSISSLTCIAMERYVVIAGMKNDALNNGTGARKVAIVCLAIGIVLSLLPFCGVGTYDHEPVFLSCAPAWWSKRRTDVVFIMLLFACYFFLPVCLITFSYTGICVKVCTTRTRQTRKRRYIKLTLMSFLMVVCFLLSWVPYTVFALRQAFIPDVSLTAVQNMVPAMMAKSCILWNPIIYVVGIEQFRNALKQDLSDTLVYIVGNFNRNCQPGHKEITSRRTNMDQCENKIAEIPREDKQFPILSDIPKEKEDLSKDEQGGLIENGLIWVLVNSSSFRKDVTVQTVMLKNIQVETSV